MRIDPAEVTDVIRGAKIQMHVSAHYLNPNRYSIQLPSSRFKYNRWTDIPQISIKGPDLNAPRIREAPKELNPNQADKPYRVEMENWEQTEIINFRYDSQHTPLTFFLNMASVTKNYHKSFNQTILANV